jgi:hypothetical protein
MSLVAEPRRAALIVVTARDPAFAAVSDAGQPHR